MVEARRAWTYGAQLSARVAAASRSPASYFATMSSIITCSGVLPCAEAIATIACFLAAVWRGVLSLEPLGRPSGIASISVRFEIRAPEYCDRLPACNDKAFRRREVFQKFVPLPGLRVYRVYFSP